MPGNDKKRRRADRHGERAVLTERNGGASSLQAFLDDLSPVGANTHSLSAGDALSMLSSYRKIGDGRFAREYDGMVLAQIFLHSVKAPDHEDFSNFSGVPLLDFFTKGDIALKDVACLTGYGREHTNLHDLVKSLFERRLQISEDPEKRETAEKMLMRYPVIVYLTEDQKTKLEQHYSALKAQKPGQGATR